MKFLCRECSATLSIDQPGKVGRSRCSSCGGVIGIPTLEGDPRKPSLSPELDPLVILGLRAEELSGPRLAYQVTVWKQRFPLKDRPVAFGQGLTAYHRLRARIGAEPPPSFGMPVHFPGLTCPVCFEGASLGLPECPGCGTNLAAAVAGKVSGFEAAKAERLGLDGGAAWGAIYRREQRPGNSKSPQDWKALELAYDFIRRGKYRHANGNLGPALDSCHTGSGRGDRFLAAHAQLLQALGELARAGRKADPDLTWGSVGRALHYQTEFPPAIRMAGILHFLVGEYQAASELLTGLLESGGAWSTRLLAGYSALLTGQGALGVGIARGLMVRVPAEIYLRGRLMLAGGRPQGAYQCFEGGAQKVGVESDWEYWRGVAAAHAGKRDEAKARLEQAEHFGAGAAAATQRCVLLIREGNATASRSALDDLAKTYPRSPEAWVLRIRARDQVPGLDEEPVPEAPAVLGAARLDSLLYMANRALREEDWERAASLARQVVTLAPDHSGGHGALGAALEHLGDTEGSFFSFATAHLLGNRAPHVLYGYALAAARARRWAEAIEALELFLQAGSDDAVREQLLACYYVRGLVLGNRGEADAATSFLRRCLKSTNPAMSAAARAQIVKICLLQALDEIDRGRGLVDTARELIAEGMVFADDSPKAEVVVAGVDYLDRNYERCRQSLDRARGAGVDEKLLSFYERLCDLEEGKDSEGEAGHGGSGLAAARDAWLAIRRLIRKALWEEAAGAIEAFVESLRGTDEVRVRESYLRSLQVRCLTQTRTLEELRNSLKAIEDPAHEAVMLALLDSSEGRTQEAFRRLEAALEKSPDHPEILRLLKSMAISLVAMNHDAGEVVAASEWVKRLRAHVQKDPEVERLARGYLMEALPAHHARAGDVNIPRRVWGASRDPAPRHNLAITLHRKAIEAESAGNVGVANALWPLAWQSWISLVDDDEFWTMLEEHCERYGYRPDGGVRPPLREHLLNEILLPPMRATFSEGMKNSPESGARFERIWAEGLQWLRKVSPETGREVRRMLGHGAMQRKDFAEAARNFEELLAEGIDDIREVLVLRHLLSAAYHNMGMEQVNQKRWDEAIARLEKARTFHDEPVTRKMLAMAYLGKAIDLANRSRQFGQPSINLFGQSSEVSRCARMAKVYDPENPQVQSLVMTLSRAGF